MEIYLYNQMFSISHFLDSSTYHRDVKRYENTFCFYITQMAINSIPLNLLSMAFTTSIITIH